MITRPDDQNPYPHHRTRRRHRRRRKPRFILVVTVLVLIGGAYILTSPKNSTGSLPIIGTNQTEKTVEDIIPPMLYGVRDLQTYAGDSVSYLGGVTATDDIDSSPTIMVDSRGVDLSQPGEYEVVYTATDASGNSRQTTAKVTVLEKQADFVDLETIYTAVDKKLTEIIRENATIEQQVRDIYAWARLNLHYTGHSDRTDWRQTAYVMLTEGKGDCFGFYAVTKLMFERLEIPNIDVQKVRNFEEDSDHFWSLVSLDGEKNWYHFDATPRAGNGDDFCLVTDDFLNAYSEDHGGSHNRDQSIYPKTP